ncbi:hypothetical protein CBR_g34531 [Chara braunii]|uniref:cGMP-dependent protein kinase n=1 Tax=Chara braunii TaxID=69332 RepID=A0A388LIV5_CHABU|nr:hypothetical protein CBR_g34531 [Chara braunii]|eukprot:GBG82248.1 hypothetical protein CBR_g34531 [Chara braunii]
MACSYVQAAQKGMTEGDKRIAAKAASEARESMASQGTSISGRDLGQPRALGQRAIDFLIERTKITAPIKITKETHKSQDGKEEEVDVWEYPEQDIPSLHELYERHAVLFNFASKSRDLPLNEKRRRVMERLRGLKSIPGVEPEVTYHKRGKFVVMIVCVDPSYAQYLLSLGSLKCQGTVVTIQAWKPPRPPQAEASQHRQKMMKEHFWVQFDNLSEGIDHDCVTSCPCSLPQFGMLTGRSIGQGDVGDKFYMVEAGEYDVYVAKEGTKSETQWGNLVHHYTWKTYPCFGDLALIYNKPREATVRAVTDGILWALEGAAFRSVHRAKMSRRLLVKSLRSIDLFHALTLSQLQKVSDILVDTAFAAGAVIIDTKEAETLYIVSKGEVNVFENGKGRPTKMVIADGKGEEGSGEGRPKSFGDWVLLPGKTPKLKVVALTAVQAFSVTKDLFEVVLGPLKDIIEEDDRLKEVSTLVQRRRASDPTLVKLSKIALDNLEWNRTLYTTDYSEVGLVTVKISGEVYTMKRYSKELVKQHGRTAQVMRERALITSLTPSNFVPHVLCTCSDREYAAILFQVRLAAPFEFIVQDPLPEDVVKFYSASLVVCLEILHKDGLVLRGLTPEVLMLDDKGRLQVGVRRQLLFEVLIFSGKSRK